MGTRIAAREAVPALLSEVERLEKARDDALFARSTIGNALTVTHSFELEKLDREIERQRFQIQHYIAIDVQRAAEVARLEAEVLLWKARAALGGP